MSTQGTSKKENALSAKEVCHLIRECRRAGVDELSFGDLHLRFIPRMDDSPKASKTFAQPVPTPPDHDKQAREYLESEEVALRSERLKMLLVEDPQEFEAQLVNGDLLDDDGPSEDNGDEEAHDS